MNKIYDKFIPIHDRNRIQRLELFDELEEWRLIQAHYSIAVAVKDPNSREGGPSDAGLQHMKRIYEDLGTS
ncbi:leucine carboxyl methyltransferase [Cystoisospora suis]|uniref:Leucine carboxyl methyltransferase n=1 Tax=Cystoisospora suis TaxID=483139 RepID=A0A2C6KD81_9APIC|nr:leucine carboxyl methyltransferase [Cystoisospora suis]